MSSSKVHKKTIARIAAIQTIYQYLLQDSVYSVDDIKQKVIAFYQDENNKKPIKISLSVGHFNNLVKLVITNLEQIDQIISKHLMANKDIPHMPVLLITILRVGICELLFFTSTPGKVTVNEFTNIASEMLNENEIGFVNSILDKVAKENKKILCQVV